MLITQWYRSLTVQALHNTPQRYQKVGGIPRHLLGSEQVYQELVIRIQRTIHNCKNLKSFMKVIKESRSLETAAVDTPDRKICTFDKYFMDIISSYAVGLLRQTKRGKIVYQHMWNNSIKERLRLEKNAAAKACIFRYLSSSLYHQLYLALLGLQFKEDQPLAALR
ncbi:hypothetical protein PROFUN_12328, partial [Planoprotostelium fungivorum]